MFAFERQIAWRYALPGLAKGVTGLLSSISLAGLTLSVFGLIVVMSVMNGFERELQNRMLALTPHAKLEFSNTPPEDLRRIARALEEQQGISDAQLYTEGRLILRKDGSLFPVHLNSLHPDDEYLYDQLGSALRAGGLADLQSERYRIAVGSQLARSLGVGVGDRITAMLPRVQLSPLGPVIRERRLEVATIFEVGADLDSRMALMNIRDASKLLANSTEADGLKIRSTDRYQVRKWLSQAAAGTGLRLVSDGQRTNASLAAGDSQGVFARLITWQEENATLYAAVVMEKLMIFILLMSIVAVASFSIIAIVLMNVLDKRTQIAILRTMGANKVQIERAFLMQGLFIGVLGTALGASLAVLVAPRLGELLSRVEHYFGWQMFDPDVYYIAYLPTVLDLQDVAIVSVLAVSISLLVSFFPASRAARVDPVIALSAVN